MSKQRKELGLPIINAHAAGVDIGARIQVAAVPPDLCETPVQTFQAFTADIERMADWLVSLGIKTVAMESTGVYWIPVYEILEDRGLVVVLANARECKAVPGRKSDVNDAQWLQRLHACGLLRASFRPARDIAALRAYMRVRDRHLEYAAAHIQHMQKALTHMNLQLHHVVSDVTGVTGMKIIRDIVAGERDPDVLACMRDVRCRESVETIRAALVGNYQPEHVFALAQALSLYDSYQARIADCDAQIEQALLLLNADKTPPTQPLPAPRSRTRQTNSLSFDTRPLLYQLTGVEVHATDDSVHAAHLVRRTALAEGIATMLSKPVLHGDNGATLKATTVLAMLYWLGVKPSYSRPRVSDDNAYAESLFRTAKYRPEFPAKGFADLDAARTWAAEFVRWYNDNDVDRHSGIRYVTPGQRHDGHDQTILAARHALYLKARERNPARWSGATRDWTPTGPVTLNPERDSVVAAHSTAADRQQLAA